MPGKCLFEYIRKYVGSLHKKKGIEENFEIREEVTELRLLLKGIPLLSDGTDHIPCRFEKTAIENLLNKYINLSINSLNGSIIKLKKDNFYLDNVLGKNIQLEIVIKEFEPAFQHEKVYEDFSTNIMEKNEIKMLLKKKTPLIQSGLTKIYDINSEYEEIQNKTQFQTIEELTKMQSSIYLEQDFEEPEQIISQGINCNVFNMSTYNRQSLKDYIDLVLNIPIVMKRKKIADIEEVNHEALENPIFITQEQLIKFTKWKSKKNVKKFDNLEALEKMFTHLENKKVKVNFIEKDFSNKENDFFLLKHLEDLEDEPLENNVDNSSEEQHENSIKDQEKESDESIKIEKKEDNKKSKKRLKKNKFNDIL